MAITRGTTPANTFRFSIDPGAIEKIRIIYSQGNEKLFVKTNDDIRWEGNMAIVKLTQADTLKFREDMQVEIQIRILTDAGEAPASKIFKTSVGRLLEDEVIE